MYRRFIRQYSSPENSLLCVGKSLGARNMISFVLNEIGDLHYRRTALVTIDPCWPFVEDWKPNLNGKVLKLSYPVDMATNIFAALPKTEQAGALVQGPSGCGVENIPLSDVDHYSITTSPVVKSAVRRSVDFLLPW
jgi:hypothetical protein